MTWIAWKRVLTRKQDEGLGVNSIYALNHALLFKWIWRFKCEADALWVQVVKAIHGEQGDGRNTQFWNDAWMEDQPLKSKFTRLYALEMEKDVCVANKIEQGLVEGDKTKKRKKNTVANDKSVDYYPDSCGDGEEDDYDVATRAKLLQKQHRP
uniref:RNA-directed DNA polymerase, eukaryota, reverse transcriptase zinc-binding domain protein n=1 Tax=Tanacetum cinerariifolium TaxID=118510 RepID=A0A6L2KNP1_TANCI|nr:RNA-directed DNA polymerase, eukaryota, reverse transcriptase zinc-binding domain protein [Tanacetum cinerariifolium]